MDAGEVDHRSEWIASPRRLRVLFNNEIIADSSEMMLLRQHGFLPVYYFPQAHVRTDLLERSRHTTFSPYKGGASYFDISVGEHRAPASAWTYGSPLPGSPDTRGYFSFHWHAMDAWFEEDEPAFVHARDPYLRAETLSSSRHVVVRLHDQVVAQTTRPVLLLETGLVTRYYLPASDVRREFFEKSRSYSKCPYKGTALYLSYRHGDTRIDDAAWYYPAPLVDVMKITGRVCFWNERPDTTIEVDGEELPHVGIRRSADGGELLFPSRRFFAVPPPLPMAGGPGQLQHDFARPNGRAEGPPDELIDMEVERAGGRRPGMAGPPAAPADGEGGRGADSGKPSLFFTFGRSRSPAAAAVPPNEVPPMAEDSRLDVAPASICEHSLRRVRALVGGVTVADSRHAILYRGGDEMAGYYFPPGDTRRDLLVDTGEAAYRAGLGPVRRFRLYGGVRFSRQHADAFSPLDPPPGLEVLQGRIAFDWGGIDAWFEEDDEVRGFPRLPYHRVDAIHSSRHVAVSLDGKVLAETRRSVAVFETGQPARFYLSPLDTMKAYLTPSGRTAESPYLGRACYLSAALDGGLFADVAWSYPFPIPECPKITGLICFDESVVRIEVDG